MSPTPKLTPPVSERDHIQGSPQARVSLVEFGDYECPFCGEAYLVVEALQQRLGYQLRFVFRNFPLSQAHPHAAHAAQAAEAAGARGRFWEMHDRLYENQQALEDEDLVAYAAALGLDVPLFVRQMSDRLIVAHVREDFLSGVNGTPTFFIKRSAPRWLLRSRYVACRDRGGRLRKNACRNLEGPSCGQNCG
jgi:protein-disulfide isomerase